MKEIYKALAAFQQEVPVIHEDTEGFKYTYANLNKIFDTIKPLLKAHGLMFNQLLNGKNLETVIVHTESGELIKSEIEIDTDVNLSGMNKYQTFGSAITYFRRYTLTCMLGLITDKDIDAKGEEVKPVKKIDAKPKMTKPLFDKIVAGSKEEIEAALKVYTMSEASELALNKALKAYK
jgi:hypothetical protein